MKFGLFTDYGALNSEPVFLAFQHGLSNIKNATFEYNDFSADVAVIWSTVWSGRMKHNQTVWNQFRESGRSVIVLEVGCLARGLSWRMFANGVGRKAFYGHGYQPDRVDRFGIDLAPWRSKGRNIIIALQRSDSEQWQGQPKTKVWLEETINNVRQWSDRPIIVRHHPRKIVRLSRNDVINQYPEPLKNTYDSYDFSTALKNAWAVINWNSSPSIKAAIAGVPVFVSENSLSAPVGNLKLSEIEHPLMPDRDAWLKDLVHTEWFLEEIATGEPLRRLWSAFS